MKHPYLQNNIETMTQSCSRGINGEMKLPVSDLCIALTNRCNLYCVMCPFCSKEYTNRTYNNEPPFLTTLAEYQKILSEEHVRKLVCGGEYRALEKKTLGIHFTHGESLLNPDIAAIARYTKEMIPESIIRLSSNGTIPPRAVPDSGQLLEHVDHFCFSIDGCTAQTFEKLRTPAKFDRVMENLREWSALAKSVGKDRVFRFTVVLSSINLDQISGLVRLAARLGGYYGVIVQPLIVDERHQSLEKYKLEYAAPQEIRRCIDEAEAAARETGVSLYLNPSIKELVSPSAGKEPHSISFSESTPCCDYFSQGLLEIDNQGRIKELCYNMSPKDNAFLLSQYQFPAENGPFDLYNAPDFWSLRKEMLEGKLTRQCGNCLYSLPSYTKAKSERITPAALSPEELRKTVYGLRVLARDRRNSLRKKDQMIRNRESKLELQAAEFTKRLEDQAHRLEDQTARLNHQEKSKRSHLPDRGD